MWQEIYFEKCSPVENYCYWGRTSAQCGSINVLLNKTTVESCSLKVWVLWSLCTHTSPCFRMPFGKKRNPDNILSAYPMPSTLVCQVLYKSIFIQSSTQRPDLCTIIISILLLQKLRLREQWSNLLKVTVSHGARIQYRYFDSRGHAPYVFKMCWRSKEWESSRNLMDSEEAPNGKLKYPYVTDTLQIEPNF